MIRRLLWSTNWSAGKTIGFASARNSTMHRLAGFHHLDRLTGATPDGATWRITGDDLTFELATEHA